MTNKKRNVFIIIAFLAVILAAVLAISLYQYKTLLSRLSEDSYVVASEEISATLQSGKRPEKMTYELSKIDEGESIYKRRNNLYYGEKKNKIDGAIPFYTNDEGALMLITDSAVLIDENYETLTTYRGMYISDGYSFNYDKSQADDTAINFVKLSNGLFMNARAITFTYPAGETIVKMNGIFNFGKESCTYYAVGRNHTLNYGELPSVKMVNVTIGDQTVSYDQLLLLLGITSNEETPEEDVEPTEKEEETAIESGEDISEADTEVDVPTISGDDKDAEADSNDHKKSTAEDEKEKETTKEQTTAYADAETKNQTNQSGEDVTGVEESSSGSAETKETKASESQETDASEGEGTEGTGESEESQSEQSSTSGTGESESQYETGEGGGGEHGGDIPYTKPKAFLGEFKPDIYNVETNLTVSDPSGVMKRVVIELYWQEENEDGSPKPDSNNPKDYKLMYRRTFRNNGDIKIDNLPPGTTIYAKGLIYYYENGKTVNEVFYDDFANRFQTLGLENVDDLYVQFSSTADEMTMYPHSINIYDLAISGPNKNVVDKVSKVRVRLTATSEGPNKGQTYTIMMGMADLRRSYFYPEDPENVPVWTSDSKSVYLPSDTEFTYTIDLLDPFGTPFTHIVNGVMENTVSAEESSLSLSEKRGDEFYYTPIGYTHTGRVTPTVSFASATFTDGRKNIDRVAYNIGVNDPDGSLTEYAENCYMRLFMEDGDEPNKPVMFSTSENGTPVDHLVLTPETLSGTRTRYELWNLTAGHVYRMEIVGDYNLNDCQPVYEDRIIGTSRFSTVPLSSYGRASYRFNSSQIRTYTWPDGTVHDELSPYESATAQELTMGIDYALTQTGLISLYYDNTKMIVTEVSTGKVILDANITREAMEDMEKNLLVGTGTNKMRDFELDQSVLTVNSSSLPDGYVPKISLRTRDFAVGEEHSVWELFSSPAYNADFVLTYEEGTLSSMTSYLLTTSTTAVQGGENHDVTSKTNSTKRISFTTLKRMPYVTYSDVLLVSNYIAFYDLQLHDEDQAIVSDLVNAGVIDADMRQYILDRSEVTGGALDKKVLYDDLTKGKKYIFSVSPELIRRSTTNAMAYSLSNEALLQYEFVAGSGLQGKVSFESIGYPLKTDDGTVELQSDYSLYNASNFTCDNTWVTTSGTFKDTYIMTTGVYALSPKISITPGEMYYITGMRVNATETSYIAFYDAEDNPITVNYNTNAIRFTTRSDAIIKAPDNAAYLRFNMYGSVDGIPTYATASCYALSKAKGVESETKVPDDGWVDVTGGDSYAVTRVYGRFYADYYDANNNLISSSTAAPTSDYLGVVFHVPEDAVRMQIKENSSGTTKTTRMSKAYLVKVNSARLDWLSSKDMSHFATAINMTVKDPNNNLVADADKTVYLSVSKYDVDQGKYIEMTDDYPISPEDVSDMYMRTYKEQSVTKTRDFEKFTSFLADANQNFLLELYVYYKGERLTLDSVSFKTNRVMEVIHNRTEVAKLMRYPYGDFLVVDDLYLRDNEYGYTGSRLPFQGSIDFQGYALKFTRTNSSYFMYSLGTSGVIKNFLLDMSVDNATTRTPLNYVRGLTYINYGTIQDGVVKLNLGQGMYRKNHVSTLSESNNGSVQNICLVFANNSTNYVGTYFGGLVRSNSGAIHDIFVYCPGTLNVTTGVYGGSTDITNQYVGMIAATNGGSIDKALVVGSIAVENYDTSGNLRYQSLTSGNYGNIRNSVGVGEMLKVQWKSDDEESGIKSRVAEIYTTYGPLVPGSSSNTTSANLSNNYFYSVSSFNFGQATIGKHERIRDISLIQDISFYDTTVNQDGSFNTDDIKDGYYPRLELIEKLMKQEPKVPLASTGVDNSIRYMSSVINEQHEKGDIYVDENGNEVKAEEDFAYVTLRFYNRLQRPISNIQVTGLKVEPISGTEYEQYVENGNYYVRVKVTPDGKYRDKYPVTRFSYNDTYTTDVLDRNLVVTFSKEITQENWIDPETGATGFDDPAGFYRLGSDIDYTLFPAELRQKAERALVYTVDFTGEVDGRGHSIKNFTITTTPYLIKTMTGGSLKDLYVDDMTFNSSTTYTYSGLVGQLTADSKVNGVVIRNMDLKNMYSYGGALAGYASRATIQNTVVNGISMNTNTASKNIYAGGLLGFSSYTNIKNSFVRNANLNITAGANAEGVGGFIGVAKDYSTIMSCYAHGAISSAFIYTGGLIGNNNAIVSSDWTKVNINSTAPYVGGITGILDASASMSQVLAVGDVFTTASDNFGRINGGFVGQTVSYPRSYAAKAQKMNSVKSDELYDASGLMTLADLKTEQMYWNYINLGEAFSYRQVENGYMPKLLYLGSETVLLPEQEDGIQIQVEEIETSASGISTYTETGVAPEDKTGSYNLSVDLTFYSESMVNAISLGDSTLADFFGENFERISIANMIFYGEEDQPVNPSYTIGTGEVIRENEAGEDEAVTVPTLTLHFENAKVDHFFDSYQVEYTYEGGSSISKLMFTDSATNEEMPLYHHIYRAYSNKHDPKTMLTSTSSADLYDMHSWQDVTTRYGENYENYLLMNDIDFSKEANPTVTNTKNALKMSLKIGRIEGNKGRDNVRYAASSVTEKEKREYLLADAENAYYKFKGLSYTESSASGSGYIYELQTAIRFVDFVNNSWSCTPGGETGFIKKLSGVITFTDFHGNSIDYGKSTGYVGFVSRQTGEVEYVRIFDMKLFSSNPGESISVSRIGGMSGYATGKLTHVYAKGTGEGTYQITGAVLSTKNSGSYAGGIVGYATNSETDYLYADNVNVTTNTYAGGIAGYTYGYSLVAEYAMWQTHNSTRYNKDQTGITEGELPIYAMACVNSNVTARTYAGGVGASLNYMRYAYSANNTVHATTERAAGITAAGGGTYFTVISDTIISDGLYAGGAVATPSGYGLNQSKVIGTNVYAQKYAGGLYGYYSGDNSKEHDTVSASAIYAENCCGGLGGLDDANSYKNRTIHYALINEGTMVGGLNGLRPAVTPVDPDYVYNLKDQVTNTYTVSLESVAGNIGSDYVGGITGRSHGTGYYCNVVDDSVQVNGRQYVGGVIGYGGGGDNYSLEVAPYVYASLSYAGSYAGFLTGYDTSSKGMNLLQVPVTKISRSIFAGTVSAGDYVGGLAGHFDPGQRPIDPETGAEILDSESGYTLNMSTANYSRILLAHTALNCDKNVGLVTANKSASSNGVAYLRIYDGIMVNGVEITPSTLGSGQSVKTWADNKMSNVSAPYLVTTEDMLSAPLYYGRLTEGGLQLNNTASYANTANQYYYYFDTLGDRYNVAGVVPTLKVFPFATAGGSRNLLGYWMNQGRVQDGIPVPEKLATASLMMMSYGLDDLEEEPVMPSPEEVFEAVSVYASGISTVNFEVPAFARMYYNATYEIRNASGNVVVNKTPLGAEVLSIPYDYKSPLTVTLTLGSGKDEEKSFAIAPDVVKRTVMTYKNHAWYLKSDGVYCDVLNVEEGTSSSEKALAGEYVHLYKGMALSKTGEIVNLETAETVGTVDFAALGKPMSASVPAYETEYFGTKIRAYRMYSVTDGNISPFRMISKDGELFTMDPGMDEVLGQNFKNFIAGYYSTANTDCEYLSILNDTGVLTDYMTRLTWPMDENGQNAVKNAQIAEVADNVYASVPYVLLRYSDNTVACFNFETGSLIFRDTDEKVNVSFGEYAASWMAGFSQKLQVSSAYQSANTLVNTLSKSPISDDELVGYVNLTAPANQDNSTSDVTANVAIDGEATENGKTENVSGDAISGGSSLDTTGTGVNADGVSNAEDPNAVFTDGATTDVKQDEKDTAVKNESEAVSGETANGTQEVSAPEGNGSNAGVPSDEMTEGTNGTSNAGTADGEGTSAASGTADESGESGDSTGSGEGNGSSEGNGTAHASGNPTYPEPTEREAYVTVITSKSNGYEVYRAEDLLTRSGASLLSENKKLEILKENGLRSDIHLEDLRITEEKNRAGLLLIGSAALVILSLLSVLYLRKRKMDRK